MQVCAQGCTQLRALPRPYLFCKSTFRLLSPSLSSSLSGLLADICSPPSALLMSTSPPPTWPPSHPAFCGCSCGALTTQTRQGYCQSSISQHRPERIAGGGSLNTTQRPPACGDTQAETSSACSLCHDIAVMTLDHCIMMPGQSQVTWASWHSGSAVCPPQVQQCVRRGAVADARLGLA